MVVKKDYIPRTDDKLLEWGKNFMGHIGVNIERFKVPPPGDQMHNTLNSFEVLLKKCQGPNRGKVDTFEKNEARRRFVNEFRTYVQGFIAKNPFVSNADREKMQITVYDKTPSRVGAPVGLATASIVYLGGQVLELLIEHVAGTEFDERANYGYRVYYDVVAEHQPQPEHGSQLTKSRFTHHRKEKFEFAHEDVKKMAYFSIRYENSKGQSGPWGPVIAAIIP